MVKNPVSPFGSEIPELAVILTKSAKAHFKFLNILKNQCSYFTSALCIANIKCIPEPLGHTLENDIFKNRDQAASEYHLSKTGAHGWYIYEVYSQAFAAISFRIFIEKRCGYWSIVSDLD